VFKSSFKLKFKIIIEKERKRKKSVRNEEVQIVSINKLFNTIKVVLIFIA